MPPLPDLPFYLVNAFAPTLHKGNQAAVVVLQQDDPRENDDDWHRAVAADFGFSETAFLVPTEPAEASTPTYKVQFWTPTTEVPMCGHATFASAFALLNNVHAPGAAVVSDIVAFKIRDGRTLHAKLVGPRGQGARVALDFPVTTVETTSHGEGNGKRLAEAVIKAIPALREEDIVAVGECDRGFGGGIVVEIDGRVDLEKLQVDPSPFVSNCRVKVPSRGPVVNRSINGTERARHGSDDHHSARG